ncbi:hypothetical protein [Xanthomonas euvesicatoria]
MVFRGNRGGTYVGQLQVMAARSGVAIASISLE